MTDSLYETEHYRVVPAENGLPTRINDDGEVVYRMPGYNVVSVATGQVDGEMRSLAEAMSAAFQWTAIVKQVKEQSSTIKRVEPRIPNEALN